MTHTAEPMTLESVRDFHRKLATEHKVIPPLSDAHAAMADVIDAELAKQREVCKCGVYCQDDGSKCRYTHPQQRNAVEVTEAMVNAGAKFVHDHGDGDLKPQAFYAGIFNEMLKANQSPSFELCRFNHHPDPAIDFCVEVESLLGEIENQRIGFKNGTPTQSELDNRIEHALDFKVGGDPGAVLAKQQLRAAISTVASRDMPLIARHINEWHEDDGPVAWWAWCGHEWAGEPAWCGTPHDSDWPGYHTHWTKHPDFPQRVDAARRENKP